MTPSSHGRPLPLFAASLRVARIAPFHGLVGKRRVALLLLAYAPLLVILLQRGVGRDATLGLRGFVDFQLMFYIQAVLPLTMLFLGAAAVGDDIDDGTVLYLRLRPLPRAAIVIGRYASACLCGALLILPAVTLVYVGQLIGRDGAIVEHAAVLGMALLASTLAIASYGAFFLTLSLLMRHAVICGVLVISAWELGVSRVPAPASGYTVAFHGRSLMWSVTDEGRAIARWMRPFQTEGLVAELIPTAGQSILALSLASISLVVLAGWIFKRREYQERPGDA